MASSKQSSVTLYAEQEHAGLCAIVVLAMVVSYFLSFWLINILGQLLPERIASLGFVLACLLAAPLAVGVTWLLERWLKRVWRSGYSLVLHDEGFYVSQPDAAGLDFDFAVNYSNLNWYFNLAGYKRGGRERRVSDKWLCLCCQVQQDEQQLIVYAFASPKETAVYATNHPLHFEQLNPTDIYDSRHNARFAPPSRPNKLPTDVISGKHGRYWLAEQRRWQKGLELTFEDFEIFLTYLQSHNE